MYMALQVHIWQTAAFSIFFSSTAGTEKLFKEFELMAGLRNLNFVGFIEFLRDCRYGKLNLAVVIKTCFKLLNISTALCCIFSISLTTSVLISIEYFLKKLPKAHQDKLITFIYLFTCLFSKSIIKYVCSQVILVDICSLKYLPCFPVPAREVLYI